MPIQSRSIIPILVFVIILLVSGGAFYANYWFNQQFSNNESVTPTPDTVNIPTSQITRSRSPFPTIATSTKTPTQSLNLTNEPNPTNADQSPTPRPTSQFIPTHTPAPQAVKVTFPFVKTIDQEDQKPISFQCSETVLSSAYQIVNEYQSRIEPIEDDLTACTGPLEVGMAECIDGCGETSLACLQQCAQTWGVPLDECYDNYEAAKNPLIDQATVEMVQYCIKIN